MASIPPIPPLMCSTPPPMDFGEEDEEDDDANLSPTLALGGPADEDLEFGGFALPAEANANTKTFNDITATPNIYTDVPPDLDYQCEFKTQSEPTEPQQNQQSPQTKSPPAEAFNVHVAFNASTNETHISDAVSVEGVTRTSEGKVECDEKTEENLSTICAIDSPSEFSGNEENSTSTAGHAAQSSDDNEFSEFKSVGDNDAKANIALTATSSGPADADPDVANRSQVAAETSTTPHYVGVVKIEDIEDDSSDDERRSPRKIAFTPAEDSVDFFTIHNAESCEDIPKQLANELSAEPEIAPTMEQPSSVLNASERENIDDFDDFNHFASNAPLPTAVPTEFSADFSVFGATMATPPPLDSNAEQPAEVAVAEVANEDEDDFEDFQDFSEALAEPMQKIEVNSSAAIPVVDTTIPAEIADETDDDFGDFAEANFTPAAPPKATVSPSTTTPDDSASQINSNAASTATNAKNLNERLKGVLELMFPIGNNEPSEITVCPITGREAATLPPLQSIDTAIALEYQWGNSEMRHALIRSLGIDSRNILFGEKWNPSMPRFAANLSFNPLKPQPASSSNVTAGDSQAFASATSTITARSGQGDDAMAAAAIADVPAVEFDWNSAGLVNPLDGSKEEDVHARAAETLHAAQLGPFGAADVEQQQQPSCRGAVSGTDVGAAHDAAIAAGFDAAAAPPAAAGAAAAAALPPDVPPDSVGDSVQQNGEHADIGGAASRSASGYADSSSISSSGGSGGGGGGAVEQEGWGKAAYGLGYGGNTEILTPQRSGTRNSNKIDGNHDGDNDDDADADNEVVTTSTYAGPLKETHIYTPSRSEGPISKIVVAPTASLASSGKSAPTESIDFDYDMAAAGIIIDETVVKKEYRDVEYNPPEYDIELARVAIGKPAASEFDDEFSDFQSVAAPALPPSTLRPPLGVTKAKEASAASRTSTPTFGDEMILSPAILLPQAIAMNGGANKQQPKIEWGDCAANINPEELARIEELFPQPKMARAHAASSASSKSNINNNNNNSSNSPKSSPARGAHVQATLSISATVAHKELRQAAQSATLDEDDWSDFVSVPASAAPTANNNRLNVVAPPPSSGTHSNHLLHGRSSLRSPHRQPALAAAAASTPKKAPHHTNRSAPGCTSSSAADDEWSDFVCNAAPAAAAAPAAGPAQQRNAASSAAYAATFRMAPQFNSGAWQSTNFYSNPLSFYHQNPGSIVPNAAASPHKNQQRNGMVANKSHIAASNNNNYNNNNNNKNNNNYSVNNNNNNMQQAHAPSYPSNCQRQQPPSSQQHQQKIHIMQDFSTAPPYNHQAHHHRHHHHQQQQQQHQQQQRQSQYQRSNVIRPSVSGGTQFQVGTAKVAPSVSLIPDLGFVAPALPTHTAFINALPSSFSTAAAASNSNNSIMKK